MTNKENLTPTEHVMLDEQLSAKAKGIFNIITIFKRVTFTDILSYLSDGKDSVRSGINELIDAGYILMDGSRKSDGTYAGTVYCPWWWNILNAQIRDKTGVLPADYPEAGFPEMDKTWPIYLSYIKLHSPDSENPGFSRKWIDDDDVPFDTDNQPDVSIKKGAGKLPKTNPDWVQYLDLPDPSTYIEDQTDEDDMMTLSNLYETNSWQYKFAVAFWSMCHQYRSLTVPQWMKRKLVIMKWADSFDKVIRTRKGTYEQLRSVMKWLTTIDDFWFKTGNLATPEKFHERYTKGGCNNRFDMFVKKMLQDSPPRPVKRRTYTSGDVEKMIAFHSDVKNSQFKRNPEGLYVYFGEQTNS